VEHQPKVRVRGLSKGAVCLALEMKLLDKHIDLDGADSHAFGAGIPK
jgi:hypothetical protein